MVYARESQWRLVFADQHLHPISQHMQIFRALVLPLSKRLFLPQEKYEPFGSSVARNIPTPRLNKVSPPFLARRVRLGFSTLNHERFL